MTSRGCGFNPRAPCGARLASSVLASSCGSFNPRAPCGARPATFAAPPTLAKFQSTRPVRGATFSRYTIIIPAGSFNPRAPCGARLLASLSSSEGDTFQSTRPVRGATSTSRTSGKAARRFNPRAPCGARPNPRTTNHFWAWFQSTRPVRGATLSMLIDLTGQKFQSTRPVRGATARRDGHASVAQVSIHAPRAGRDVELSCTYPPLDGFNPRAPCGARPLRRCGEVGPLRFQSTRPVRGATEHLQGLQSSHRVSIHAPRAGRDGRRRLLLRGLL